MLLTEKITTTGFAGFAQEADREFEREYILTQTGNGLTIRYDEAVQRISTEIDVSTCGAPGIRHRIKGAVWDTGATTSSISKRLAEEFGLKPIDTGMIVTATGKAEVPIYLLDIHLTQSCSIPCIKVFGSPMKNRGVDFLIGMDVISKGKLTVDSTSGKTVVTFEVV